MMKYACYLILSINFMVFGDTLDIAVYNSPPCVIINNDSLSGFDIDILNNIVKESNLNIKYHIVNSFTEVLNFYKIDYIDGAISGITITGDREKIVDFTHPYINSGLNILINKNSKINIFKTIIRYIKMFGPMLLLITIFTSLFGALIFFVEKKYSKKDSLFGQTNIKEGIFNGYYFGNVTSTTMGFGDIVPKSVIGKILTVIMAYIGIYFTIPYATANMQAALQEEKNIYEIRSHKNLIGKIVGTEANTTSEDFLRKAGCNIRTYSSIGDTYKDLEKNNIDAVVFDMPHIKYFVKYNKNFVTSGETFDKQPYGIALKKNSKYRKILNQKLLDFMRTEEYWNIYNKWFN